MNTSANNFSDSFHIGAYYLQKNARTERHIHDIKDCGIDMLFGVDYDVKMLDLLKKYGVFAVVSGIVPFWFGGDGSNAGTMRETNKIDAYTDKLKTFVDHGAIIGIDIGDEPSSEDFPYYGEIIALVKKAVPAKLPYLNIYPSYGMLASSSAEQTQRELGTASYAEYLERYGKYTDLPYLSFDHYVYSSDKRRFLSDLRTTSEYCRDHGKKLHVILQANSREPDVFISEEQLCFQAFCALAHGASAISWACYCAGWWHNNVLDSEGEKTEQYEKLKNTNSKLLTLASEYIKFQLEGTEAVSQGDTCFFDVFRDIKVSNNALVGKFKKGKEGRAVFVCLTDETDPSSSILSFHLDNGACAYVYNSNGCHLLCADDDGAFRVVLNRYDACFITVNIKENTI